MKPIPNYKNFSTKGIEEAYDNVENYMFFKNLENIKNHIDFLLSLNPQQVDMILKNGHGWAVDHMATSKDDIEEVSDFLRTEVKNTNQ